MSNEKTKVVVNQNTVYALGFVGALVWYFQHSASFGGWVLGFLKSILWPAVLVYRALEALR